MKPGSLTRGDWPEPLGKFPWAGASGNSLTLWVVYTWDLAVPTGEPLFKHPWNHDYVQGCLMDLLLTWRHPNCPSVWDLSNKQYHNRTYHGILCSRWKGQGQSRCHPDGTSLIQNEVKTGTLENRVCSIIPFLVRKTGTEKGTLQ